MVTASAVEIGVMGFPYRSSAIMCGNAMQSERDGAQAVWYPDHIMGWHRRDIWRDEGGVLADIVPDPHAYADPFVACAITLMITRRVRVGISVTDTYRRHPVSIAQAAATLAEAAPGRFVLGLGTGEGLNTKPLAIERERPVARLREALAVITALLGRSGAVSYVGEHFNLDRVPGMSVEHPPQIVLGGHSDGLLRLVGEFGTGWLPVIPTTPERYAARLEIARTSAEKANRDPAAIDPGLYVYAVIHDDANIARKALEGIMLRMQSLAGNREMFAMAGIDHPLGPMFAGLRDFVPEWMSEREVRGAVDSLSVESAQRVLTFGTPEEVVAHLNRFAAVGARRIVIDNLLPLGLPEELDAATKATHATVRAARIVLADTEKAQGATT